MKKRFWLIQRRMKAGFTQRDFSKHIGMHETQYRAYENGHVFPRSDQQLRIAKALNFDVKLWYTNEEEE